jgi:transposase
MGKAYSEDLRLKALAALDGGQTKMAIHKSFGIARSTLDDWIALRLQQGHLAPVARAARPGHGFFNADTFEAFAHQHGHNTLGQMRLIWQQEQGQLLSEKTFSTWMARIGWTRKKSHGYTSNGMKRSVPSS